MTTLMSMWRNGNRDGEDGNFNRHSESLRVQVRFLTCSLFLN